ncbi:MAG TPA: PspC domain-containing protein [Pricia sp.]|nr:PspC domain-containing protein [Pricia sp.]
MDLQNITHFFTRPEKSLLGVCSSLSKKLSLPPVALRIALIILTLLFIPLGVIIYVIAYLIINPKKSKIVTFGLLGAVLGIPLSYYFQSDIVKFIGETSGMFSYLKNFAQTVDDYNEYVGSGWEIVLNVLLSIVVFSIAGGAIGYFMDKKETDKI